MYTKEVERVLNAPSIIRLTGNKLIFKIQAKNEITQYVVYKLIDERPAYSAEGEEKFTRYTIQVDVNGDFYELKKEILKQAKLNGWKKSSIFEGYDSEKELFFCCIRFNFDIKEEI
ncbi:MAG: hypothetical protein ACRDD7_03085 [Peptostreptococcaceae bacterium]